MPPNRTRRVHSHAGPRAIEFQRRQQVSVTLPARSPASGPVAAASTPQPQEEPPFPVTAATGHNSNASGSNKAPQAFRHLYPQHAPNHPSATAAAAATKFHEHSSINPTTAAATATRSPSQNKSRDVFRSDIFTSWRTQLPDGRVEVHILASQARVATRQSHRHGHAPPTLIPGQNRSSQAFQAPRPPNYTHAKMVHETRHHDYDHDVDIDASPSSKAALMRDEGDKSNRKAVARASPASKVHRALQFPLLILGNWLLSAGLYSAVIPFTAGDLATVSRSPDGGWLEIGALVAFKTAELAVGWWGEYDGYDLGSLTLLTHAPYLFLLGAFYSIKPSTLVAAILIDITSTVVPVQLLRPLSAAHDPRHASAGSLANRRIVTDVSVQLYTSALASAVYALFLTLSFLLGLPTVLVSRFDYISDLTLAHSPSALPLLFLAFAPLGLAASVFVFTPSTAATRDGRDAANARFDPQTASLAETLAWNVWGYDRRTRVAMTRSSILALVTAANTFLQVTAHVAGTEPAGAAVYAAVWTGAAVAVGTTLWWTANVKEVKSE